MCYGTESVTTRPLCTPAIPLYLRRTKRKRHTVRSQTDNGCYRQCAAQVKHGNVSSYFVVVSFMQRHVDTRTKIRQAPELERNRQMNFLVSFHLRSIQRAGLKVCRHAVAAVADSRSMSRTSPDRHGASCSPQRLEMSAPSAPRSLPSHTTRLLGQ